jgi:hypothetical protein
MLMSGDFEESGRRGSAEMLFFEGPVAWPVELMRRDDL